MPFPSLRECWKKGFESFFPHCSYSKKRLCARTEPLSSQIMRSAFSVKHLNLSVLWASSTAVAEGENYARFCTSKLGLKINASGTCFAKFLAPEGRFFSAQSPVRHPTEGGRSKGRLLGPAGNLGCCSWPKQRRRARGEEGCSATPASALRAKKPQGTELESTTLKAAFEMRAGMRTSVSCIPQHHPILLQSQALLWFVLSQGHRRLPCQPWSDAVMHPTPSTAQSPPGAARSSVSQKTPQLTERQTINVLPPRFPESTSKKLPSKPAKLIRNGCHRLPPPV